MKETRTMLDVLNCIYLTLAIGNLIFQNVPLFLRIYKTVWEDKVVRQKVGNSIQSSVELTLLTKLLSTSICKRALFLRIWWLQFGRLPPYPVHFLWSFQFRYILQVWGFTPPPTLQALINHGNLVSVQPCFRSTSGPWWQCCINDGRTPR